MEISLIIFLIILLVSFYYWKKSKEKIYIVFLLLSSVSILTIGWDHYIKDTLGLSVSMLTSIDYFVSTLWFIIFTSFTFILIKYLFGKNK
jgi:hypothetical protein